MKNQPDNSVRVRFHEEMLRGARIKVVGIGGGGSNAVNRMIEAGMEGVEFISVNTDLQSLQTSSAQVRLQLGVRLTRGLGAGANPETGRQAALEDPEKIVAALEGADMVFITAGLGGGTGTGAAPIVAALASQMGALTVAIVTRPFGFEGKRRMGQAERGLQELLCYVDTLIVIPNEKLLAAARNAGFFESFKIADDVLQQAVRSISEIITVPGVINRDFADVRATMAGMGFGVMGTASRSGPNRATEAALAAIASPLLELGAIDGARGILINITGSNSLKLSEVYEASTIIQEAAHEDANIIFGAVLDEGLGDEVKITVIATGFHRDGRDPVEGRKRILCDVRQPVVRFEEAPAQKPYVLVESRASGLEETDPETIGILRDEAPVHEAVLPHSSSSSSYVSKVGHERIDNKGFRSIEMPHFEVDTEQGPNHVSLAHVTAVAYEMDLLATIDGAPFDLGLCDDETTLVPALAAPAQSEIVRLRQAAITAYSTMPEIEDENEEQIVSEASSFAAVLEGRQKALDVEQVDSGYTFDDEEMLSDFDFSASPDKELIAVIEEQWSSDDGSAGGPDIENMSLRSVGLLPYAAPADSSASKFSNLQNRLGAASSDTGPINFPAKEPVRGSGLSEAMTYPVTDFKHGLNRDPEFWREWELSESRNGLHAHIPSFATVSNPDESSMEPDELDIPSFLRPRT